MCLEQKENNKTKQELHNESGINMESEGISPKILSRVEHESGLCQKDFTARPEVFHAYKMQVV